ncbi:hypothetical protein BSY238_3577 [Methyloversatilis sp. RAC08]|nr:hypothetical protein BSY238_3577 [Methyloversatilis sp. RAC08]
MASRNCRRQGDVPETTYTGDLPQIFLPDFPFDPNWPNFSIFTPTIRNPD